MSLNAKERRKLATWKHGFSLFMSLNLRSSSFQEFVEWEPMNLGMPSILLHTQRSAMVGLPTFADHRLLLSIFKKFDATGQHLILREISHTFQTNQQIAKWDPEATGFCQIEKNIDIWSVLLLKLYMAGIRLHQIRSLMESYELC